MTQLRLVPVAEATPAADVRAIGLETTPSPRNGLIFQLVLDGVGVELPGQSLVTKEELADMRPVQTKEIN